MGADDVVKQLEDREFTFKYTCCNDAEAIAKVSKNKPFESPKQYPLGTECTVKEEAIDTEVKWQKWTHTLTPSDGKIKINAENTAKVVASNTYTQVPKGKFTVNKKLEGPATLLADESVQNRKFKGRYRCGTQEWTQFEFSVKVPFVSPEYPEETLCYIEERTDSTEISGFTWSEVNGNKQKLSILHDNNANIQVELINKYTQKIGGFKLTKFVDGPAASLAKGIEYKFDYVCGEKTGSLRVKEGETVDSPADIPINTECAITESEVNAPAGVTWVGMLLNSEKFIIKEGETVNIHAKNTFEHSKGGFSILKTVGGDAADLSMFKSKHYEFNYVCDQPNGQLVKGTISATPGKSVVVKDILVGSKCEVTEAQSAYPNVDWLVEFSGEGVESEGNKATFNIADSNSPSVNLKVKNTFTQYKGGFSIEKSVIVKEGIKTPQEFVFTWTCGNTNGEVKVPVKNGKGFVDVSEEKIPVGTSCVVVEKDSRVAGAELATEWKNQRFTIGKRSEIVQVSATNTYKHETGGFLIEKQIIGGARDKAVDKTFTFNYVCNKDGKEIRKASTQIKGEGSSEFIDALPVGTECRIEEQDAKIAGAFWKHTISDQGKFKISSANVIYKIAVVNGYESPNFLPILPLIPIIPLVPFIVGPPQPPVITPVAPISKTPPSEEPHEVKAVPARDKSSLAKTGANTLGIAFVAVLLVGIGLLLVRRNRKRARTN